MTVVITDYTNSDAVRGAIGLTDNEVTDGMLADQNIDKALTLDLDEWLPTHATIYADGISGTPTADQVTQWSLLQLYSMWWCACRAAKMVLAIPEKITDSKAEMKRFNDLDLKAIADEACGQATIYQGQLQGELGETSETTRYGLMGSASPNYDPVTNEGA